MRSKRRQKHIADPQADERIQPQILHPDNVSWDSSFKPDRFGSDPDIREAREVQFSVDGFSIQFKTSILQGSLEQAHGWRADE